MSINSINRKPMHQLERFDHGGCFRTIHTVNTVILCIFFRIKVKSSQSLLNLSYLSPLIIRLFILKILKAAYNVFFLLELVVFFLPLLVLLELVFPPSAFNSFSTVFSRSSITKLSKVSADSSK